MATVFHHAPTTHTLWLRGALAVLMVLPLLAAQSRAATMQAWRAGTARAKITPTTPLWLAGFGGRTHPATGTLHDLWLKVLALQAPDGQRAVVVTSDLEGLPKPMYERIVGQVAQRCGLARAQLMLTISPSHTAPVLSDLEQDLYPMNAEQARHVADYSRSLETTIVAKVAEALANLSPATLAAGTGTADFAVNRRNNPEADVPKLRAEGKLKGPVDHSVPVLAVRAPDGTLRAVVFGYSCHCTTLSGYDTSGDYAGFAQLTIEQRHKGAQAMFTQACGGDQNPLPRRTLALCQDYGNRLATAVEHTLTKPMRPLAPRLTTRFAFVDIPFASVPTAAHLRAAAKKGGYHGRWGRRLLKQLEAGTAFPTAYPYPVQAWTLGDQLWIALGGETVVDYALTLKARYGPRTWVNGYANDVMAYIPSHRVWKQGGYEAGAFVAFGMPALQWAEDIEQRIADTVDQLVRDRSPSK